MGTILVVPLPVGVRLDVSRRKDPALPVWARGHLCLGFGFDPLNVSEVKADGATDVQGWQHPCMPHPP